MVDVDDEGKGEVRVRRRYAQKFLQLGNDTTQGACLASTMRMNDDMQEQVSQVWKVLCTVVTGKATANRESKA